MMKKMINSFKIAFSMYSKIPMPQAEWTKKNMEYAFVFFPWIGIVTGGLFFVVHYIKEFCQMKCLPISDTVFAVLYVLIPLFVTGGIHMDGYLDTKDAMSSWQTKERRLEILKDPHTGAFAVIWCGIYLLCQLGVYSCITNNSLWVIVWGFCLSRSFSGLSVLCFPKANKTGTVAHFSENVQKKAVAACLVCYVIAIGLAMVILGKITGAVSFITAFLVFCYYKKMSMKYFGGVTGDLAGYFLQVCELWIGISAVAADMIGRLFM